MPQYAIKQSDCSYSIEDLHSDRLTNIEASQDICKGINTQNKYLGIYT